ncbi:MAG: hypothetical protein LBR17_00240 [Bacteroidales bacterium]|jgi:hypothetical protein|nr:hypothetical protein [Bacteroidales bacterium]
MKVISKIIIICSVIVQLMSCEGFNCGEGVVYDSVSKIPIDNVKCKVLTGSQIQYSNNEGHYEVCNEIEGCMPDCKDIKIEFSKQGYKTKIVTNPSNDTIYLDKD